MSEQDDPYEGLDPVAPAKGKKKAADLDAMLPDKPDADGDLDLTLAFQDLNDFGNANRLIARHGDLLMYVANVGWFVWDGARWNHDGGESEALKLAHKTAYAIASEAKALRDKPGKWEGRVAPLARHAVQSGNKARHIGMLDTAAPYRTVAIEDLDRDTMLLATPNGTIELAGLTRFRASAREDRITRSLAVRYVPGAVCPLWEKFLSEILPDEEMREFLRRILGYCLTGSTREHKLFIFYGTGRNGKSTLINVLRHVMGDYAVSSPVQTFLAKRDGNSGSEASPDLARLPGARVVSAAEPPEGARLDESKVKEMTGGDPMTVRHLNQGFFEFRPNFKAIISTNHQPTIRGTDHGIWSRINLVPFTVQIQQDKIDRGLEEKLLAEAEGILQWMLTGTEDWFAAGLAPPSKAIAAVEDYRADQDPVGEFLKSRCDLYALDYFNPSTGRPWETGQKQVRDAYVEWCKEEGLEPMSAKAFGSKLTGRGIQRRKSNGLTLYQGLWIKTATIGGTNEQ